MTALAWKIAEAADWIGLRPRRLWPWIMRLCMPTIHLKDEE